ncbi:MULTISPECIES: GntR family transcriptional regulator [Salinicoccus]|uniref:GntR family transcriptional regulator n=1 Tax=Salinicoccus TaxID=45669 RepID=UPI00056A31A6|nr:MULTISPECIES: GntR family transcriptional regulator [Salinicoccus]RPE54663.1 GntR family transcriptional regulator [Salinicoccus roseus]GGA63734.1 GntR family transcriptional regulator [Salinicoccus roseus]
MQIPKYQKIAIAIKDKIIDGEYRAGTLLPTEKQLQVQYDVSRHTIRQAMEILVNDGFAVKRKGAGSYVSNAFLSKSSQKQVKKIGVIVTYLSDYIFPSIIRGIETVLRENGYSLILASTNNNHEEERRCLEMMLDQEVQGLIIEPTKSNTFNPNLSYYSLLKKKKIPTLMINARYEELNIPFISIDDTKSGFIATEYLLEHGHQDIALITKIDDLQGKLRMKGYIKAFEEHDTVFKGEYIYTFSTESRNAVVNQVVEHIEMGTLDVTAIVCYNDEIAYDLNKKLRNIDYKIPEDISLIGEDNSILSRLEDTLLTTTSHPQEDLGMKAANWIVKAIQDGVEGDSIILDTSIIERNSVKALN